MASEADFIHRAILEDAARIANALILDEPELARLLPENKPAQWPTTGRFNPETRKKRYAVSGQFYRPDPNRSQRGGLALSLDESVRHLPSETIQRIHAIANRAIRSAINAHPEYLGYLFAQDAVNGENYFDRFRDPNEQISMI